MRMKNGKAMKIDQYIKTDYTEEEVEEINTKYNELILEPYNHLNASKGKNIRTKMCNLFNYWFGLPQDDIDTIYGLITKVHNGSLLIDDIQDSSYLRRSVPAAHVIYGSGRTFTCVNFLESQYLQDIPKIHQKAVKQIIMRIVIIGIKGQIMDAYWRDNFICPTEEEYADMIYKKTGCFIMFIVELLQRFSGKYIANFAPLCNLIALYFQIMDDYCNLKSTVYHQKKGFCEDISEGKFSFPIIYAVRKYPEDTRIKDILKMNTTDYEIKKECLQLIKNYGGFAHTENKLKSLREKMFEEIIKLGGDKVREDIFMVVSGFQDKDLFELLMQQFKA